MRQHHNMSIVDTYAITEVTRALFQGARTQSPDLFQDWAMEQLQLIIPFDSGKWISGSVQNNKGIAHSTHVFHQPDALMQDYLPKQDGDLLLSQLLANPGQTLDLYDVVAREAWIKMDIYTDYCQCYGIEHAISTAVEHHKVGLLTVLSIYSADYGQAFTSEERKAKEILTAVMADARNLNLFLHLSAGEFSLTSASAVCDIKGTLREAEPSFAPLLLHEWPDWQGPVLNFVPEDLLAGNTNARLKGNAIIIKLSTRKNLVLLEARKRNQLDTLTPAERKVAKHLMRGLSNKEIGRALGIAAKTVSHHLQSIYKKTNVPNR